MDVIVLNAFFIGVISGVVAAFVYALILLIVKPRITVSAQMCKDPDEKNVYRVKVVNKSWARAINVSYSLIYFTEYGDGIMHIEPIEPCRKDRITSINGRRDSFKDDYAVRLSYEIDGRFPADKGTFEFTILASHAFSDTVTCVRSQYTADKIVRGVFETGKSTKIIVSNKEQ